MTGVLKEVDPLIMTSSHVLVRIVTKIARDELVRLTTLINLALIDGLT